MLTPNGLWYGDIPAFDVHGGIMNRVACKIVLGLFYLARGYPKPESHDVYVGCKSNKLTAGIAAQLSPTMTPEIGFGDDVFHWRFTGFGDHPATSYWWMVFYRTLMITGATLPREDLGATGEAGESRLAG